MIPHQAIGITAPALLENFLPEERQKMLTISIVEENQLLRIAPSREMIERTGIFQTELASHGGGA